MIPTLKAFLRDDSAQGLPEYALLIAAVVALAVALVPLFGGEATALIARINAFIDSRAP